MPLPSSGPLSLNDIQTEFGGTNPISLNEYYAGGANVPAGTSGTNGAVPSSGAISISNFYGTSKALPGQQEYTTAGTYSWVAPSGVSSVSVIAVGGGAGGVGDVGGPGGALAFRNNYSVTAGSSYTVVVGAGGLGRATPPYNVAVDGGCSYFVNTATLVATGGPSCRNVPPAGTTFSGGGSSASRGGGGGGAGGYSCTGRLGIDGGVGGANLAFFSPTAGVDGAGGGGGGGGGEYIGGFSNYRHSPSGGGGGVGILGQGANGAAGVCGAAFGINGTGGGGGSGGANGGNPPCNNRGGNGGAYGGGGGAAYYCTVNGTLDQGGNGAGGAVRIIWPGNTRSFPSTNTGNL